MTRKLSRKSITIGAAASGAPTCGPVVPGKSTVQLCQKRTAPLSPPVRNSAEVCAFLRPLGNADRESFYTLQLDVRGRVTAVEEVSRGILTGVEVHPREAFKSAVLGQAAAIIVAHNHPSGDPSPSREDIQLTARLADAGRILGIPVRDHIIVGGSTCYSLRTQQTPGIIFDGANLDAAPKKKKSGRRGDGGDET
jgi:DNA repair protein RadC